MGQHKRRIARTASNRCRCRKIRRACVFFAACDNRRPAVIPFMGVAFSSWNTRRHFRFFHQPRITVAVRIKGRKHDSDVFTQESACVVKPVAKYDAAFQLPQAQGNVRFHRFPLGNTAIAANPRRNIRRKHLRTTLFKDVDFADSRIRAGVFTVGIARSKQAVDDKSVIPVGNFIVQLAVVHDKFRKVDGTFVRAFFRKKDGVHFPAFGKKKSTANEAVAAVIATAANA